MGFWGQIMLGDAQQVERFIRPRRQGERGWDVEGKGNLVCLSSRKKASAGGDWSEVVREHGRKGGQGAGHVETYRPGLGDGIYSKPLGEFQQVKNKISLFL